MFAGVHTEAARLWQVASGKITRAGKGVMGADNENVVRVLDAGTGQESRAFRGHSESVRSLAFSPDGRLLATGDYAGTIKLWDAASGKELTSLQAHGSSVSGLTFTADGTRLLSASWDETVKVWDLAALRARR